MIRTRLFTVVLLALSLFLAMPRSSAWAADAAPPTAAEIAEAKTAAENMRKLAAETLSRFAGASPALRDAAKGLADAYSSMAQIKDKMAGAIQANDEKELEAINTDWTKANEVAAAQENRIHALTYAEQLTDTRPLDAWKMTTPESAKPLLESFLKARAVAAGSWTKVATLAQGGASAEVIEEAKDAAILAGVESNIAQRLWTTGSDVANRLLDAEKIKMADFNKAIEELKALDQQAVEAMHKSVEADLLLRRIDRLRQKASERADEMERASAASQPATKP